MAAGHGDAAGIFDFSVKFFPEFGETVRPCLVRTVRRRSVYHADVGIFYHGNGLFRRAVGQTQKRDVRRVQHLFAGDGILAQFFGEGEQFYVLPRLKPRVDLQPRGAVSAVYKNLFHCKNSFTKASCFLTEAYPAEPSEMRFFTQFSMDIAS